MYSKSFPIKNNEPVCGHSVVGEVGEPDYVKKTATEHGSSEFFWDIQMQDHGNREHTEYDMSDDEWMGY